MKNAKPAMLVTVLLTIGSAITIGFGAWHLFVPSIWSWYSYIPGEARELVVAIRAINVFFSMSLVISGAVMLVFTHRKPMVTFYTRSIAISLTVLWGLRVALQLIWPQGSIVPALRYGMLGIFVIVFAMFLYSSCFLDDASGNPAKGRL